MKLKILSILILGSVLLAGCGFWGVRGNGHLKHETRDVEEFTKIDAAGAFTVKVKVGESTSLRIEAEENLLHLIETRVKGNTLIIDTRKNISPRKGIRIYITTPELESVECSGANNIVASNIDADNFYVDLSGAGSIDLEGTAEKLHADLSGAGSINAKRLKAGRVSISVSGAASADVYASEYLDASVSGVGSIDFYGNPQKTNTSVSGVGSITRK